MSESCGRSLMRRKAGQAPDDTRRATIPRVNVELETTKRSETRIEYVITATRNIHYEKFAAF